MAKTLAEWSKEINEDPNFKDMAFVYQQYFHRDPLRTILKQPDVMLSSADGIIVHNGIHKIDDEVFIEKGEEFDLETIIGNNESFWNYLKDNNVKYVKIISIFMTYYNVHLNRVPIDSKLKEWTLLPSITSKNYPMLDCEEALRLNLPEKISASLAGFWSDNERVCNHFVANDYNLHYLVNQIADDEVNSITPFIKSEDANMLKQGARFSKILRGSQNDIILPIINGITYEDLCQVNTVVEAGIDPLVRIISTPKLIK